MQIKQYITKSNFMCIQIKYLYFKFIDKYHLRISKFLVLLDIRGKKF